MLEFARRAGILRCQVLRQLGQGFAVQGQAQLGKGRHQSLPHVCAHGRSTAVWQNRLRT